MSMLQLDRLREAPPVVSAPAGLRPRPGSAEELARFAQLQQRLVPLFQDVFPDPRTPRTVVVVPSLSMDQEFLAKIEGVQHYEERLLCLLMLLRLPRTRLIYLTSLPVAPAIIDYYLHLLPGIPGSHARKRLTLLSCHDASTIPLSQKILERPRMLRRIREAIPVAERAHMTCFNASPLERTLAVQLGIPLYGCDPSLAYLGTKSGSRTLFRTAGIPPPEGFEQLRDRADLIEALMELKRRLPALTRAVVKHEEGASGEGNAVFTYDGCPDGPELRAWIRRNLWRRLRFEAAAERWDRYLAKFDERGGIVERFIETPAKRSPSVQCRITPLGEVEIVSTHDQVLGGPSGQIFLGCTFPADDAYRRAIQDIGLRVGEELKRHGALGRYGIDFISVRRADGWIHYPIEINLRKGGTTHPFLMLQYLTDGTYNPETGRYVTPTGQVRYYTASDTLQNARYRGLTPDDLIDITVDNDLHFHGATQQGVVFHLIGALSEYGKLGVLCIADSPTRAHQLYYDTVAVLDRETTAEDPTPGDGYPTPIPIPRVKDL